MIHNGFKLNTTDIFEIHKLMTDFREGVKPLVADLVADFIAQKACYFLDFYTTVHEELKVSPLEAAIECFRDYEAEGNPTANNYIDLILYPHDDTVFGLYFTKQKNLRDFWLKQPGVKEFDVPENVITDMIRPEMCGLLYHGVNRKQELPKTQDVLAKLPDFDFRVKEISLNVMFLIYQDQNKDLTKGQEAFEKFNEWLKTDVGNNTLKAKEEEVSGRLKKEITEADLLKV